MAYTIPSVEPTELSAGDSWEWDRHDSQFPPSDGWTLAYHFNGPSAFSVAAATSASGDYYEVRRPAAENASRAAGAYRVTGYVSRGTSRKTVFQGVIIVAENFATSAAALEHAETMLTLCETAIEARLTGGEVEEFSIGGREVKKIAIAELRRMRSSYAEEVRRLRNPGASFFKTVKVTLAPPS